MVPRTLQFSFSYALEKTVASWTDNVHAQISQHIFAPNGGYCLFTMILSGERQYCSLLYNLSLILNLNCSANSRTYSQFP